MAGLNLSELAGDFFIEAGELVEGLSDQLIKLEKRPDDAELLNAVFRAFHTVKGGAGFLEFAPMVDLCHDAEEVFDALRHGEITLNADTIDAALETVDVLGAMIDTLRAGERIGDPPDALSMRLREAAVPDEDVTEFQAGEAAKQAPGPDPAGEAFDALLAEAPAAASDNKSHDGISDDEFEALLDELHGVGQAPGISTHAAAGEAPPAAEVQPASIESRPAPAHSAPGHSAPEATLRVDTRRLDTLVNLAGELVLARNRLLRLRPAGTRDPALDKAIANLDLITTDLQTSVMGMRMQPVRKLFSRFPKLVRELARGLGKQVDLALSGEATELDKSLVEALADPLVHLMRNAVDHGIESPAERSAAGKPETGQVRLGAARQGDQITITIADDGRGMDPDALRARAVEKGLVTREAAARLAPPECYELIFMPGFSTRLEVSEISGRGVGMDVVKSRIAELNGCIEIDSALGAGSEIRINVPLTLAILPTLMVRVRARIFALPIANIAEVFGLDPAAIKTLDGREVITVRSRALPVMRLDCWAAEGAPLDTPPAEEHVVIARIGAASHAVIVDDVLGREEVVIKPLGSMLSGLAGIAGATMTGEGRIALIVDFASLFHDPRAAEPAQV
jgi:two-component system chemotaxis sensor kinase CheA